jgi:glycosyltransferase involved in cell wall biosynthesis
LADSETTRNDLIQFCRIPDEKITVVYPAYDAQVYRPVRDPERLQGMRARFRIGRDYILAIGTIHPRKNYSRLIEAFSTLSAHNYDLVIVGKKGWLHKEIFERVKNLRIEPRVRFLDYVPASEMPALVSGAGLLVFPSLHEGFGLPILEAQACGTPVVCSMTSSLPEAAGDGALFIDPCDVNAIAAAIERALTDAKLRSKIVENGFRNLKRFSWEKSAGEVLRVIRGFE